MHLEKDVLRLKLLLAIVLLNAGDLLRVAAERNRLVNPRLYIAIESVRELHSY
jgi:hypothetical protein